MGPSANHPSKYALGILFLLMLVWGVACGTPGTPPDAPSATPPTPTTTPTPVPGSLHVDAGASRGAISPLSYGTNFGPWITVPIDLQEAADAAGITYLRFPGGNWGDQNDLRDYQIDQFMTLAGRMGAEPSISARLRGGTPEQAADLVTYTNVENDYDVRYWSIGNEPGLYDDYDTERYNAEWRAIAEAMLAVDPDILLIGPDVTQFTGNPETDPRDEAGRDWMREFLLANGDLVDIVAIHRYPFPTGAGTPATIDDLRANSREWDTIIPNLRAVIRETTGRDLPVAVTEVNSHWSGATGGDATPDSLYNAIWWGDVLGRLIGQRVEIVAHFALQSPANIGGWGLLGRYDIRPTYYVYQLYQRFGSELVHASSGAADVSIIAALCDDGVLTLMVINLGPEDVRAPLRLENFTPGRAAEVWRLDAAHMADMIDVQRVADGETLTIPAQSMTLYVLPAQ